MKGKLFFSPIMIRVGGHLNDVEINGIAHNPSLGQHISPLEGKAPGLVCKLYSSNSWYSTIIWLV